MKEFVYETADYNENSAEIILPFILDKFPIKSIVDIGCGVGSWLSVAKRLGLKDVLGIDSSVYNSKDWYIQSSEYMQTDLIKRYNAGRSFDLAICLEVGEHLPESNANDLISMICNHAPLVLFSAAIPGQRGSNHINEQWPEFWQEKFLQHGFEAYDILRPVIWNNEKIQWWYRQNAILYAKKGIIKEISQKGKVARLVSDSLYEKYKNYLEKPTFFNSLKMVAKSIKIALLKK